MRVKIIVSDDQGRPYDDLNLRLDDTNMVLDSEESVRSFLMESLSDLEDMEDA